MSRQQPPSFELSPRARAQIAQAVQPLVQNSQRHIAESTPESGAERARSESAAPGPGQLLRPLGSVLPGVLKEEAGQPVRDALSAALDILFADPVRESLQHQAEAALRRFLLAILETIDDEATRRDLQQQTEHEFSRIVRQTLQVVFTGACREQLKRHLERAIDHAFDGDIEGALQEVKRGAGELLPAVIGVLDEHWEQILPLLLRAGFHSLREAVEPSFNEGLMELALPDKEDTEGKAGELAGSMDDKAEELQDRLTEATDELRARLRGEKERMRKNIKEGVQSALKGDTSNRRAGRPPSGRPPMAGRPPKSASRTLRPPPGARRPRSMSSSSRRD